VFTIQYDMWRHTDSDSRRQVALQTSSVTITDNLGIDRCIMYQKRKVCCCWLLGRRSCKMTSRRQLPVLWKISGIFWLVCRTPTRAAYTVTRVHGTHYPCPWPMLKKHCTAILFSTWPVCMGDFHERLYTRPVNTGCDHRLCSWVKKDARLPGPRSANMGHVPRVVCIEP